MNFSKYYPESFAIDQAFETSIRRFNYLILHLVSHKPSSCSIRQLLTHKTPKEIGALSLCCVVVSY